MKALETGLVPPVAELQGDRSRAGAARTSRGAGPTRCDYALRLAAGFGSQIGMSLLRWVPTARRPPAAARGAGLRLSDRRHRRPAQRWLGRPARLRRAGAGSGTADAPDQGTREPRGLRGRPHPRCRRPSRSPSWPRPSPPLRLPPLPPPCPSRWPRWPPSGHPGGSPSAPAAPAADPVKQRILALVAAKTGYPPGDARPGPGPRGRSRHRHREAGRAVRVGARGVGHPARREAASSATTRPSTT